MASNLGKNVHFVVSSCHLVMPNTHLVLLLHYCVVLCSHLVVSSRRLGFSSHCLLVLQLSSACIVIQFSLCLYTSQAIARDRLCCLSSLSFSAFLGWLRLLACLIQLFVAKSPGLPLVLFSSGVQSAGLKPSHTAPD